MNLYYHIHNTCYHYFNGCNSWVSLGYFAVNLSRGQPKMYWWLCCTGVKKLHTFAAKHKFNTYSEKLFPSDDCASIWSWPPVKLWRHMKPKSIIVQGHWSRTDAQLACKGLLTIICNVNACCQIIVNRNFIYCIYLPLTVYQCVNCQAFKLCNGAFFHRKIEF